MASTNDNKFRPARKASSLNARNTPKGTDVTRAYSRIIGGEDVMGTPTAHRKKAVWVDVILLTLLVAVVVGGVFGYRAVKGAYSPEWETRDIVFVVEFSKLDVEILPDYWHVPAAMYTANDEIIGYTMEGVPPHRITLPVDESDGRTYATIRMTLQTTAQYRTGAGYYCGNVHILAGLAGNLRIDGVSGIGRITAVYEADEYTALTAAEAAGGQS